MDGLKVENLEVWNGSFRVKADALEVKKGEIVSLMGGSGSGKSTFLNALAGFLPLKSGEITADGRDLTSLPPEKRRLGYVFQKGALFPHLTLFQNLEFSLKIQNIPAQERERKVMAWLEKLEILKLRDRLPKDVSGGEGQRAAFGRALITGFPYLLLDEPFSSLDVSLRAGMRELLRKLTQETGVGALLVTHDPEDAKVLSRSSYSMKDGILLSQRFE